MTTIKSEGHLHTYGASSELVVRSDNHIVVDVNPHRLDISRHVDQYGSKVQLTNLSEPLLYSPVTGCLFL